MTIKLLDDNLINKIAAGEVIERPASIVKELVENAIDADSDRIEVHIDGGGIDRIEVGDNGVGIDAAEVVLALQRHATSKITREDDLSGIDTLGFRGEALPSIASVSRLELYTQAGNQAGIHAVVEGGKQLLLEPYPTAPGTQIVVRDIFFNTPARRKFMKSAVSEGIHVHDVVSKLALSRPDVSFTFSNEKKIFFKTPGNGRLRDTVIAIYGQDYTKHFKDLAWQGENYALAGLISKPELRRGNRKNQIFFVNRRLVKSQMLFRAVEEAYRGLLLGREYPAVIMFLTIPPGEVDVNVHPQKTEVRFRDEKLVFRMISRAIRDQLDNLPNAAIDTWAINPVDRGRLEYAANPGLNLALLSTPEFRVSETQLAFGESPPRIPSEATARPERQYLAGGEYNFAVIGQCFDSYILVQKDSSLWLVDQHAAHERINYNRLLASHASQATASQMLAFPLAFDLSTAVMDLLQEKLAMFAEIGFDLEALGPNSAIVRSAPALLQGKEIEVINECLQLLEDERPVDVKKEIFALIACKQAVKAGQNMSRQEMAVLVNDLVQAEDFRNCPHGRPTILELTQFELNKRFKRT